MAPLYQDDFSDDEEMYVCHVPLSESVSQQTCHVATKNDDVSKSDDPFLFYSNDDVRMSALKLKEVSETERPTERKTRISFELHPDLVLEEMADSLYDSDEVDFKSLLQNTSMAAESPNMELLKELLHI